MFTFENSTLANVWPLSGEDTHCKVSACSRERCWFERHPMKYHVQVVKCSSTSCLSSYMNACTLTPSPGRMCRILFHHSSSHPFFLTKCSWPTLRLSHGSPYILLKLITENTRRMIVTQGNVWSTQASTDPFGSLRCKVCKCSNGKDPK